MHADEDFLRRFLVASSGLPRDLAAWSTAALIEGLPRARRIAWRDGLLRDGAALLPPGPAWTRARQLHAELLVVRRALPTEPDLSTARGHAAAAILLWPSRTLSVHQIYRVLTASRSPLEVQEAPVSLTIHGRSRHRSQQAHLAHQPAPEPPRRAVAGHAR